MVIDFNDNNGGGGGQGGDSTYSKSLELITDASKITKEGALFSAQYMQPTYMAALDLSTLPPDNTSITNCSFTSINGTDWAFKEEGEYMMKFTLRDSYLNFYTGDGRKLVVRNSTDDENAFEFTNDGVEGTYNWFYSNDGTSKIVVTYKWTEEGVVSIKFSDNAALMYTTKSTIYSDVVATGTPIYATQQIIDGKVVDVVGGRSYDDYPTNVDRGQAYINGRKCEFGSGQYIFPTCEKGKYKKFTDYTERGLFGLWLEQIPSDAIGKNILANRYRYNESNAVFFTIVRENRINVYKSETGYNDGDEPLGTITRGERDNKFENGFVEVYASWIDDYFRLTTSSYSPQIKTYEDNYITNDKIWRPLIDDRSVSKANMSEDNRKDTYGGNVIPAYDLDGRIISQGMKVESYTRKMNGKYVWDCLKGGGGTSLPDTYTPTKSGTAGQMLQSNGDAEPTWVEIIKSVKITQDEYDALESKDGNTLYLIVEE